MNEMVPGRFVRHNRGTGAGEYYPGTDQQVPGYPLLLTGFRVIIKGSAPIACNRHLLLAVSGLP